MVDGLIVEPVYLVIRVFDYLKAWFGYDSGWNLAPMFRGEFGI